MINLNDKLKELRSELAPMEIASYLLNEVKNNKLDINTLKTIDLVEYSDVWIKLQADKNIYPLFAEKLYSEHANAKELLKIYGKETITEMLKYMINQRKRV